MHLDQTLHISQSPVLLCLLCGLFHSLLVFFLKENYKWLSQKLGSKEVNGFGTIVVLLKVCVLCSTELICNMSRVMGH